MLTKQLAARIAESDPLEDEPVLHAARRGVLDWLASVLAAKDDETVDKILSAVAPVSSPASASVLGRQQAVAPLDAALINGYMGHALDYDDVHASVRGHPSAVILPALLALAEEHKAAGRDFLSAYIIGVETMCRLGLALGSRHYESGWHSTSTLGVLGAAAACSRLLVLNVEQTASALSIAATQSSGMRNQFGSQVKPLHAGLAARAGLMSAKLAAAGITGADEVFEGPGGYLAVYGYGEAKSREVLQGWGQPWQIADPGLWFKRYPCCSAAHHAADAVLTLRETHTPQPSQIKQITVTFPPGGDAALVVREPRTGVEGRFSVEYIVAAALIDGELNLNTFADEPIRADLQRLADQVERRYDAKIIPAANAVPKNRFTIVDLVFHDGTIASKRVDCPRGAPGRPLTDEEIAGKYADAVRGLPDAWSHLPEQIAKFETLADLSLFVPKKI